MQYGGNPPEEGGGGTNDDPIDPKNANGKKDEDKEGVDDNKTHSPNKPSPQPTGEVQMSPGGGYNNSVGFIS